MATIKTQLVGSEQRIITKSGLISCSCCEEPACCPYEANELSVGYLEQDLPDTITITFFLGLPKSASRTGSVYQTANFPNPSFPSVTTSLRVSWGPGVLADYEWTLDVINNGFASPVASEPCLFIGLPDAGIGQWQDDFFDEYEVSTTFGTFTMTRQSLCTWTGTDPNYNGGSAVTLRLNNASASRPRANLWTIAGIGRTDGGPYKSPEGTYSNGTYTWTVAAP